jgi:hypothetical protein
MYFWYVGQTEDVERRFERHLESGK